MMMIITRKLKRAVQPLFALMLSSCYFGNNDNGVTPPSDDDMTMCLEVMGERYEVPLPCDGSLNLRTLTTEFPVEFKVLNAEDFSSITIAGHPVTDGACSWELSSIPLDEQFKVEYTTASRQGTFNVNFFPEGAPKFDSNGQGQIPGNFYLSFIYQPLIMKVDNDGQLVYYRFEPTKANGTFQELGFWDFKKHVFDGKTYYSYHAPDLKYADKAMTGYVPGMRILMDEHYVPVDTIHALASSDGYLSDGAPLDGHDFYFFSPTHWIASASYVGREVNGEMLAVAYLQEVDNGEVVFDWWSTDHPDMVEWGSPVFDTSYDYVHFNSIDVLPDGDWLVSLRAVSSVVKVSHGTGAILWHIDGEALDPEYSFSGQHYVRYHIKDDNSYITVFDNGNAHDPSVTRAVRLRLGDNLDALDIESGEHLSIGSGDYFTQACGAFQDFGEQGFVMGWGWSMEDGNCTRLVSEHSADGTTIFEINRKDDNPYSVSPSYRCVKCE